MLDRLPGPAGAVSRARLAGQTIDLIADFPFTGGGLASFPGLHSHYILGIPFYYLPNGHNIILDVTLEQGLLGALALLIIIATTFWFLLRQNAKQTTAIHNPHMTLLTGATLSSFLVLLLHGMVEDTVYGSAALPLLFVAPALTHALSSAAPKSAIANCTTDKQRRAQVRRWHIRTAAVFGVAGLALLSTLIVPQGRATWWANLGAVNMARAQLADFPTGQWAPSRQANTLQGAENLFQQSLYLNPQQHSAQYYMGLVDMLDRDYDSAVRRLEVAYAQDPEHFGVRKALGYSYAWSGNVERGRELLDDLPFVSQELGAYVGWWRRQGRDDLAETAAELLTYFRSAGRQSVTE